MESNTARDSVAQASFVPQEQYIKNIIRYIGIPLIIGFVTLLIPGLVARLMGYPFVFSSDAYLTLHNIAEIISIVLSFAIAAFGWHSFREAGRRRDLVFATSFLAIAVLDTAHMLSFPGMPAFITANSADKTIIFWMTARFAEAGVLLAASFWVVPHYIKRRQRAFVIAIGSAVLYAVATFYIALYISPVKQLMFIQGKGLTPLKIGLEYGMVFIALAAVINIGKALKKNRYRDGWILLGGIVMFLFSEVAFTLYKSPTDLHNFVGHILKIGAMIPIYSVLFVSGLEATFHELTRKREAVEILNQELEGRVIDRTQKLAEANRVMTEEKEQLRILLESIGDGVVAIDRNWIITVFNDAAANISGWAKEEALGKPFRSIIKILREQDRKETLSFIEDAIVMNQVRQLEEHAFLVTKSGKEVPLGDSAAPIRNSGGKVVGAIVVFRDKTDEKNANMLRSDFAYASHQLRTPVTKALWSLEATKDKVIVEDIREEIDNAYHAIQSVNRLSNELIEVSKIDQQEVSVSKQVMKIADLCSDVGEIREEAKKCNIVFQESTILATAGINTDLKLFKRIIHEILDNAIKYSEPNGVVKMTAEIKNNTLEIAVEDFGCGIMQEEKPLVFTKFFRGRNFDTTAIVGAGLGLYIAQEYAKLLGGKIWFEPKEKGTIFYITLPIA